MHEGSNHNDHLTDFNPRIHTVKVLAKEKDSILVSLRTPIPQIFDEIVEIVGRRNHNMLEQFKKKYSIIQKDVLVSLQKLAFVMEFCRSCSIPTMVVEDELQIRPRVMLDLQHFAYIAKNCCRPSTGEKTPPQSQQLQVFTLRSSVDPTCLLLSIFFSRTLCPVSPYWND